MTQPNLIRIGSSGIETIQRHDLPITQFQVLGERGSGTNVMRKLMERNLDVQRVESLGWKHGFPQMVAIPRNLLVVCVVRHPWDWARSLYARPWHAHPHLQSLSFAQFIRHPWHSIVDRIGDFETLSPELDALGCALQMDRHPITGEIFNTIFDLRNAKLAALRGLGNRGCNLAFVRLEAVQDDPETAISYLSSVFHLPRGEAPFRGVNRRLGNRFMPSVADREPPPATPSDADLAHMKAHLNLVQEADMGYSID